MSMSPRRFASKYLCRPLFSNTRRPIQQTTRSSFPFCKQATFSILNSRLCVRGAITNRIIHILSGVVWKCRVICDSPLTSLEMLKNCSNSKISAEFKFELAIILSYKSHERCLLSSSRA